VRLNQLLALDDFDVGPWRVRPSRGELEANGERLRLEPKVMRVLVALARRPGETVAREQLLAEVWEGRVVTDDAVQRCIAALRRTLRSRPGVDIETLPKLGYVLRLGGDARKAAEPRRAWPYAVLALALAVAAVLWWISADIPASSTTRPVEARSFPLTAQRGREVQPALSPSGGQVAYVWTGEDGRDRDLHVRTIDGHGSLRLTDFSDLELRPTWSPDGAEIAFVRMGESNCTLERMPAIGGTPRRIADCGARIVHSLDWSPDARRLAITIAQDELAPGRLQLIDVESGEARIVSAIEELGASIEDARFSPDGAWLAFSAGRALGVEDIHVYRFEDRSLRQLTSDRLKVHGLDWDADGRSIVFSSNRNGPFRLWRVPLDTGIPSLVAGAGDAADDPTVSANGRIVYEVWREDAEIVRFDLADAAAPPARVVGSTRFEWDAQVSSDGGRLAYVSDESGAAEVWTSARDGSAARRLTQFEGPYTHSPRWSPDGERLAFVSPVSGRMDLFVLPLASGHARRIGTHGVDYFAPVWSADGQSLFVGARTADERAIWRVPVAGGASERVSGPGAHTAQVSPDQSTLYYTKFGLPGLWRKRLDDAQAAEEQVIGDLSPVDWNNWRVTPTAVFYVRRVASAPELMRWDASTRTTRAIRPLPQLLYKSGLWISPDERELLATVVVASEADLQLIK
jgi:Tol biopolymer transport system component/DNA-binding winged helix-turn-helix (wHTH) protein